MTARRLTKNEKRRLKDKEASAKAREDSAIATAAAAAAAEKDQETAAAAAAASASAEAAAKTKTKKRKSRYTELPPTTVLPVVIEYVSAFLSLPLSPSLSPSPSLSLSVSPPRTDLLPTHTHTIHRYVSANLDTEAASLTASAAAEGGTDSTDTLPISIADSDLAAFKEVFSKFARPEDLTADRAARVPRMGMSFKNNKTTHGDGSKSDIFFNVGAGDSDEGEGSDMETDDNDGSTQHLTKRQLRLLKRPTVAQVRVCVCLSLSVCVCVCVCMCVCLALTNLLSHPPHHTTRS